MSVRSVVQFQHITGLSRNKVMCLCDDGTMWTLGERMPYDEDLPEWRRFEEVPQDEFPPLEHTS